MSTNGKDTYDFNEFRNIKKFGKNTFNGRISIKQAKAEQNKIEERIVKLENYNPTSE